MVALESVVDQIKERIDIASTVGAQVNLKKSGRSLKGLCPFHNEKTPSFYVFPDKGNYHCFGCGANGDIFTYVMRTQNLAFGDALRALAQQAGVALPERRPETSEDRALERLREINAITAQFYQFQLRTEGGRVAREYLAKRGMSLATIEAWQIGYAPEGWDNLLKYLADRGYTPEELEKGGVATPRDTGGHYDRFRNRLMMPILDLKGRIVGFGARALDDSHPKYLNSPQTPLFDKGGNLYGIDKAAQGIRELDYAVIVEGYFDVLILQQYGINNVVASLGTALTERQVSILKRLTKKLVLALDADAAGEEATRRGLEVAIQVFDRKVVPVPTSRGRVRYDEHVDAEIRILRLPQGKDPDEVVNEDAGAWARLVAEAQPVVDFYFSLIGQRLDLTQPQGKSTAVEQLLPVIRDLAGDKVQQWHYLQRLAGMVRVDERVLANRLAQMNRQAPAPTATATPQPPKRTGLGIEEYYLGLLLANLAQVTADTLVRPQEIVEPQVRQVVETVWQIAATPPPSREAVAENLDPVLQSYCAELEGRMAALPPIEGDELATAYEQSALRVQEESCRRALREYRYLIQEAEERDDLPAVAELTRSEHELNLRLAEVFRLRAQKQVFRR
ncbi:MAG: DNA primase [Chloroflexota bacterium]